MENQKSQRLTLNGLTTPNIIYILISIAMVGVSLYLTKHFYNAHFPTGFQEDSLCSISNFWGCDKATFSTFGSIFNIPTAFFGIIIGAMGIFGNIFPSEQSEKTIKFFTYLNFFVCILLFLYSIIGLQSLCPFCTAYYILSAIAAFLFFKHSKAQAIPEIKPLAIYAIITIIPAIFMYNFFQGKTKAQASLNTQYISNFYSLGTPGDPIKESPYKVHKGSNDFKDSPLRLTLFSDFQCPFCKVVSDQMSELIREFGDKLSIQYMFYPLDNACNPNIKSTFHKFACKAAYLSACNQERFAEVHDYIFKRQEELSFENLASWEKELGLSNCFDNKEIQEQIIQTINAGDQYALKSTPTMILNGRKIEGTIPVIHLKAIMHDLLKQGK